ncbi:MAG: TerB family tellurite resistance protein [Gammaproteobacteria bacterium]|nr:TerB family tellurite resistance protein [Gammaproteobacteria bacterium]
MLEYLKRLFEDEAQQQEDEFGAELRAAAILLIEVCYADFDIQQDELKEAASALVSLYGLQEGKAQDLLAQTLAEHKEVISLFTYTKLLNEHLSTEQKETLLLALWKVAHADNRVVAHEEHRIRKLAEQLHLPHKLFIQTKLQAEN